MPVEVIVVAVEPGEVRVPGGSGGCFDVVRRLNADIARGDVVDGTGEDGGLLRAHRGRRSARFRRSCTSCRLSVMTAASHC